MITADMMLLTARISHIVHTVDLFSGCISGIQSIFKIDQIHLIVPVIDKCFGINGGDLTRQYQIHRRIAKLLLLIGQSAAVS